MKKCPKCGAEIQEEARFCLYCMTSFEDKQPVDAPKERNKRWLILPAAAFVLALIAGCIFSFMPSDSPTAGQNRSSSTSFVGSKPTAFIDSNSTSSESQSGVSKSSKTATPTGSTKPTSKSEVGTTSTTSHSTTHNTSSSTTSADPTTKPSQSNPTSSGSTAGGATSNDTTSGTSTAPTVTQPKYSYVDATLENAFPTGYGTITEPEDAIVITKVAYKEESGNYVIPGTIDGKKVMAIMSSAFSDPAICSSVKSVTLPSSVKTVWSNAFENCYNLTDLYLESAVIEIYQDALPDPSKRTGMLTIHCQWECRDFNFYYYRNIADRYGANYEEWNS